MRRALPLLLSVAFGCGPRPVTVGDFVIAEGEGGQLEIEHALFGSVLEGVRVFGGAATTDVEMQFGAFRFTDAGLSVREHGAMGKVRGRRGQPVLIELSDADGASWGTLTVQSDGPVLVLDLAPDPAGGEPGDGALASGVVGLSAACDADDHFLGTGSHAFDIDHVGEAFTLWVQEPGIGKNAEDGDFTGWPLQGGRHDSSFPMPVLVRPHRGQGIVVDDTARVDLDLCATDPDRFEVRAWRDGALRVAVVASGSGLGAVREVARYQGLLELPPPWAFGPWNDAVRGEARVDAVAARLRAFGASSTAIWSEDWKGAEETEFGYRLKGEWTLDEALYPDAAAQAARLESQGFQWMAYFSPFLIQGTRAWDEAHEAGVVLTDPDGATYTWNGATFEPTTMVDLSSEAGLDWAATRMEAALDLGFDGWMADFAEWLPVDADLAGGHDAFRYHNAFPLWWQALNRRVVEGTDAVFFVRSGWLGTSGLVPVVWGGDQRTSWQTDDGFPTVLPLGLGLSASGVPVFTHDIAGYQSIGNPGSDRELWFRWASLGAFSPVMRTHHGAFDTGTWQFDSDDATTEHWVATTREHSRLFPYRYGLAAKAADDGTPMLLPVGLVHEQEPIGRIDAWLLGEGMLVAPVLEAGATGRDVDLPGGVRWWSWPALEPATSGFHAAAVEQIPVFVAEGTTIPTFADPPDTFVEAASVDPALRTLAEADAERVVYLVGGGGPFTEADGTRYAPSGRPTGAGEVTQTLTSGSVTVAGVTVKVTGTTPRAYTFVVVD